MRDGLDADRDPPVQGLLSGVWEGREGWETGRVVSPPYGEGGRPGRQ